MRIIFLILVLSCLNVTGQNICVIDSLTRFPVENAVFISDKGNWYTITGEGIGKFNVFATCFLDNLEDGTIEHAF